MNYKRSLAGIAGLVGSLALAPNVSWADYCLTFRPCQLSLWWDGGLLSLPKVSASHG